jgi:hypothetical protein
MHKQHRHASFRPTQQGMNIQAIRLHHLRSNTG